MILAQTFALLTRGEVFTFGAELGKGCSGEGLPTG